MLLKELIRKNRSYRRFFQEVEISREQLWQWVELARFSACGGNRQALKFYLSYTRENNARIFPALRWATYLQDWKGPTDGERPSAYIIILGDRSISHDFGCDHGIAAQSILLGAVEQGFGGCIIAAIDRAQLRTTLAIPDEFEILLTLALGKPRENVVLDTVNDSGEIRYWRDATGTHHVPKRSLADLILQEFGVSKR